MSTSESYYMFILDQLSDVKGISSRKMMGEYILYCNDKIFGDIYDDRLLVKITPTSLSMMPQAVQELPYPGAKPMLLVPDVDDREFLKHLVERMTPEMKSTRNIKSKHSK